MKRCAPTLAVAGACVLLWSCPAAPPPSLAPGAPRLILFLAVDQGRADYVERFRPLLRHGLDRLLAESVRFTDAHHDHANTSTAPGHATLATGRHPSSHGIVGNYWFDRETREEVYSASDEDGVRSPERLLVPTLGDWLKAASPRSKVFAAGGKDRASVLMAGHRADAAFWFDDDSGDFVTSEYYPGRERPWLDAFHAERHVDRYFGEAWEPLPEVAAHAAEYRVEPLDEGMFQTGFPYPLGGATPAPDGSFYSGVFRSPLIDRYLADFARALIAGEGLGDDDHPDLLWLSFSALDAVGHRYGPDSPELLDTLLGLDRVLGELLDFVDERIGLDRVLVSLSSDHGVMPVPEVLARHGGDGRRFGTAEIRCVQHAGRRLRAEMGDEEWILEDFYLDRELAAERGVELSALEEALRRPLEACPGIARVWTRGELLAGSVDDPIGRLFVHGFHPERSPDLTLELEPWVLPYSSVRASHGSPHPYDTHVPWLVRRPGGRGFEVAERVHTVDVAPTLAALVGLAVPDGVDGVDRSALLQP